MKDKHQRDVRIKSVADWISWLYLNALQSTGHSWTRLNGALSGSLNKAIIAGIQFAEGDFKSIYDSCRGEFWFGESGTGERFYSSAAEVNNISACASFEAWKGREPFLYEGNRLAIGSEFQWQGKEWRVNSFDDKHKAINAGCYRNELGHRTDDIQARLKISVDDFKAIEAEKRKAKRDAKKAAKEQEAAA